MRKTLALIGFSLAVLAAGCKEETASENYKLGVTISVPPTGFTITYDSFYVFVHDAATLDYVASFGGHNGEKVKMDLADGNYEIRVWGGGESNTHGAIFMREYALSQGSNKGVFVSVGGGKKDIAVTRWCQEGPTGQYCN